MSAAGLAPATPVPALAGGGDSGPPIRWRPISFAAQAFVTCPVFECLVTGDRGSAKTDALLMSFAVHVGKGYGPAWRGIIFRKTFPQLKSEIVPRSFQRFTEVFPGAHFNHAELYWTFSDGAVLRFRPFEKTEDYWSIHGAEYPFVGWDELTNWKSADPYTMSMSVCRSSHPGVPKLYRATSNSWGPGRAWIKRRFIDPAPIGTVIRAPIEIDGKKVHTERIRLQMLARDNPALLTADPLYRARILAGIDSEEKRRAWLGDDWNIRTGGRFADVWEPTVQVLRPFKIPSTWRLDRSFDWGDTSPCSCGIWAESDGTDAVMADGTRRTFPRGTLFRVAELYTWTGKPNEGTRESAREVGRRVLDLIKRHPLLQGRTVHPGPADPSIFTTATGSIAADMEAVGLRWTRASNAAGTRSQGWSLLYSRLAAAVDLEAGPDASGRLRPRATMTDPGLFVFDTCRDGWIRTVPELQSQDGDPDDVEKSSEDHAGDETRYRLLSAAKQRKEWVTRQDEWGHR